MHEYLSTYSFTFTGKERDEETGYTYHGARYFDAALLTSWMAVDPMSDKYPSLSPYNYCAWNPVKLVDEDGMDIWRFDAQGNSTRIENNEFDQFQVVDKSGNVHSSKKYSKGTITEMNLKDGSRNTYFNIDGDNNAKELFEFLAGQYNDDNDMPLEWNRVKLSNNNQDNIIGTSHKTSGTTVVSCLRKYYGGNTHFALRVHNHPSGSVFPDESDMHLAAGENCYLYTITAGYIQYDSSGRIDMPQSEKDALYDYTVPSTARKSINNKYNSLKWRDL